MDGRDHYLCAQEFAEEAHRRLGQEDGRNDATAWAALAQVHATLALAAATVVGQGHHDWFSAYEAGEQLKRLFPNLLRNSSRPRCSGRQFPAPGKHAFP